MRTQLFACGLAALLGLPAAAAAQSRMPHEGARAAGGEVGIFLPREDALKTGPVIEGFYEHYLSARESVRVGVGWMNPKWEPEDSDSLRQVRIGVDLIHNWEGGAVHPYVGAGLGAYFLQFRDNGASVGDSETKFGGNLLGGVEYFTSNTFAIKGEARYHLVPKATPFDLKPTGLSLTFGVKSYF